MPRLVACALNKGVSALHLPNETHLLSFPMAHTSLFGAESGLAGTPYWDGSRLTVVSLRLAQLMAS